MENLEIWEKVSTVPDEAKKTIQGGKLKGFTDINPVWRLKKLTEVFGACGIGWYTDNITERLEQADGQICAFVSLNLYVKQDGEWSKPIYGTGGSKFASSTKNGTDVSDECFKMAYTDAISVAAKALGIGASVYWEKGETKYEDQKRPDRKTKKEIEEEFQREQFEKSLTHVKKLLLDINGGDVDAAKQEYATLHEQKQLENQQKVNEVLQNLLNIKNGGANAQS